MVLKGHEEATERTKVNSILCLLWLISYGKMSDLGFATPRISNFQFPGANRSDARAQGGYYTRRNGNIIATVGAVGEAQARQRSLNL
jgi:hypothetical protein